jgi:hypothetical protein
MSTFLGYLNDEIYLNKASTKNNPYFGILPVDERYTYIIYPPYYLIEDILFLQIHHPGKKLVNVFDIDNPDNSKSVSYMGNKIVCHRSKYRKKYHIMSNDIYKYAEYAKSIYVTNDYDIIYISPIITQLNAFKNCIDYLIEAHKAILLKDIQHYSKMPSILYTIVNESLIMSKDYVSFAECMNKIEETNNNNLYDIENTIEHEREKKYIIHSINKFKASYLNDNVIDLKNDLENHEIKIACIIEENIKRLYYKEYNYVSFITPSINNSGKFGYIKNWHNYCYGHSLLWSLFSCRHVRDYINTRNLFSCSNLELLFIGSLAIYSGSTGYINYKEKEIINILHNRGFRSIQESDRRYPANAYKMDSVLLDYLRTIIKNEEQSGSMEEPYGILRKLLCSLEESSNFSKLFDVILLNYKNPQISHTFDPVIKNDYTNLNGISSNETIVESWDIVKLSSGTERIRITDKLLSFKDYDNRIIHMSDILVMHSKEHNMDTHKHNPKEEIMRKLKAYLALLIECTKDAKKIETLEDSRFKKLKEAYKQKEGYVSILKEMINYYNDTIEDKEHDYKREELMNKTWDYPIRESFMYLGNKYIISSFIKHGYNHYISYSRIDNQYFCMDDITEHVVQKIDHDRFENILNDEGITKHMIIYERDDTSKLIF